MWRSQYGGKLLTTSDQRRSLNIRQVSSAQELTDKSKQYLTFKQSEKAELLKLGLTASSVHEYQGKQTDDTIYFHASPQVAEACYKQVPHMLVATTRHRRSCEYATACVDDDLAARIRDVLALDDRQLDEVHVAVGEFTQPTLKQMLDPLFGGYTDSEVAPIYDVCFDRAGSNFPEDWSWAPSRRIAPQYRDYAMYADQYQCAPDELSMVGVPPDEISTSLVAIRAKESRVEALQQFYDDVMPGNSLVDMRYDNYNIHTGDYSVMIDSVSMDLSKHGYAEPKFDHLRPALRTSCPPVKPPTQLELLRGLAMRNSNVPKIAGLRNEREVVDCMRESFIKKCIDPEKRTLFYEFRNKLISVSEEGIAKWRETTTSRPTPEPDEYLQDKQCDTYEYMSKGTVKPDLTLDAPNKLGAPQMIACHSPDINAFFGPIFKEVKERILKVLKKKIKIFTDKTLDQYADEITRLLGDLTQPCVEKILEALEMDIGKFDKSQDALALLWDCMIMRMFGIPEEVIQLWERIHTKTRLVDRRTGLKATVFYQRKSGDAFTFMGNTMFLLGIFALIYPIERLVLLLIGGDDTLAIGHKIRHDASGIFSSIFNLEAKLLTSDAWYFCSKFLIYANERYHLVPDPIKLITKLGRSDLVNWEHAKEYRVSLKDLCKVYDDRMILTELSNAVLHRYSCAHSTADGSAGMAFVLENILGLLKDKDSFAKLYFTLPNDKLCLDPKRPKLE